MSDRMNRDKKRICRALFSPRHVFCSSGELLTLVIPFFTFYDKVYGYFFGRENFSDRCCRYFFKHLSAVCRYQRDFLLWSGPVGCRRFFRERVIIYQRDLRDDQYYFDDRCDLPDRQGRQKTPAFRRLDQYDVVAGNVDVCV